MHLRFKVHLVHLELDLLESQVHLECTGFQVTKAFPVHLGREAPRGHKGHLGPVVYRG